MLFLLIPSELIKTQSLVRVLQGTFRLRKILEVFLGRVIRPSIEMCFKPSIDVFILVVQLKLCLRYIQYS